MTKPQHLKSLITDETTGEQICLCCGQVLQQKAESTLRDRPESQHDQLISDRVHDGGLGTIADPNDSNSFKINVWQKRLRASNSEERKMYHRMIELNKIIQIHTIPEAVEKITFYLCRKSNKNDFCGKLATKPFLLALLYHAFDISGHRYPFRKFRIDYPDAATHVFKKYLWQIKDVYKITTISPSQSIEQYIHDYGTKLHLSQKSITLAQTIIQYVKKENILGCRDPITVSATALYLAAITAEPNPKQVYQDEIADLFGTTIASMCQIKNDWAIVIGILKLRTHALQKIRHSRIQEVS